MEGKWKRRPWTEQELDYLRETYPKTSTAVMAAHLGRPIGTVYQKSAVLGLKKTAEFIADPASRCRLHKGTTAGAKTMFQKGITPHNKGIRMPGYWAGRMRETMFQPGVRQAAAEKNWRPIGTILPDADGYLRVKVREALPGEPTGFGNKHAWPQLHRKIWREANGEIPAGHIVTFKDGDKTNCAIENLVLMSLADNARRNAMWRRFPQELIDVIVLKGTLNRKLRKIDERTETEEHAG